MNLRAFLLLTTCVLTAAFGNAASGAQQEGAVFKVRPGENKAQKKNASQKIMVKNGAALLQVTVRGAGETVVMLPSLGRSVQDFDMLSERLITNGFRVVLPEPRGIGQSFGPTDNLTLHDLAGDIATVIEAVSDEPVTLIGHALGNRLARVVATDHPQLVKGVVLIAAGGLQPIRPEIRKALENCFNDGLPRDQRLAAIKLAFFAEGNDPKVWETGWYKDVARYQSAANAATPVKDWWAGGKARILILQGAEDTVATRENSQQLSREYGDRVTVIEIPKAGHALLPEQPELIARAVLDFLRR
jgi:pimeloyl-ACP methyl ester carboxylesterase